MVSVPKVRDCLCGGSQFGFIMVEEPLEVLIMDDMLKSMFEKHLKPEDAAEKRNQFHAPSGFRDTVTPYDRLRHSLRRAFPFYPDVFDYTGQGPEADDSDK